MPTAIWGFILLKFAVEHVTEKSLDQYCQEEFYRKLGMYHTDFLAHKRLNKIIWFLRVSINFTAKRNSRAMYTTLSQRCSVALQDMPVSFQQPKTWPK